MTYYKASTDGTCIGIGTENDLRRYQSKHCTLLICGIEEAEYILINGTLYHDTWLEPIEAGAVEYAEADITVITRDEYDALAEAIELGEELLTETSEEEPDQEETAESTVQDAAEAITKVGYLKRLEALEEAVFGTGTVEEAEESAD